MYLDAKPINEFTGSYALGEPTSFTDVFGSTLRDVLINTTSLSRSRTMEEAYDRRIDAIKTAGIPVDDLHNPIRYAPSVPRFTGEAEPYVDPDENFRKKLRELAEKYPDKAYIIEPDRDPKLDAYEIARKTREKSTEIALRYGSGAWLPSMAAGVVGGATDPINIASLAFGPWGTAGVGIKALLSMAAKQGLVNAGAQMMIEPFVARWNRESGVGYTPSDFAFNVGAAFLFGFGVDLGIRSAYRGLRRSFGHVPQLDPSGGVIGWGVPGAQLADPRGRPPAATPPPSVPSIDQDLVVRAARGDKDAQEKIWQQLNLPKDVEDTARKAASGDMEAVRKLAGDAGLLDDPTFKGALDRFELEGSQQAMDELDRALAEAGVRNPNREAYDSLMRQIQAVRSSVDPEEPVPRPQRIDAEPSPDVLALLDDAEFARVRGSNQHADRIMVEGRPAQVRDMDPKTLEIARDLKGLSDDVDRLKGLSWDQEKAGRVLAYETADGKIVVLDGRARVALAQSLEGETKVPAIVLREQDGWTRTQAENIAIARNITEGRGTLLRAAEVYRERPDLMDLLRAISDYDLIARSLAQLSDEAFARVRSGEIPPEVGALVAEHVPNRALQSPVLDDIQQSGLRDLGSIRQLLTDLVPSDTKAANDVLLGVPRDRVPDEMPLNAGAEVEDPNGPAAKAQAERLAQEHAEEAAANQAVLQQIGQINDRLDILRNQLQSAQPNERAQIEAQIREAEVEAAVAQGLMPREAADDYLAIAKREQIDKAVRDLTGIVPEDISIKVFSSYEDLPDALRAEAVQANANVFMQAFSLVKAAQSPEDRVAAMGLLERAKNAMAVEGFFVKDSVYLSLHALDPRGIIAHEVLHALRATNRITNKEIALLAKAARAANLAKDDIYRKVYAGRKDIDRFLDEEAAAHAIQARASGYDFGEQPNRIIDRIIAFFKRLAERLTGYKFLTPQDVMNAFMSGEMARRRMTRAAMEAGDISTLAVKDEKTMLALAGVNAITADSAKLAKARDMEINGKPREEIWKETGWFRAVDGKWKFEIDDHWDILPSGTEIGAWFAGGKVPVVRMMAMKGLSEAPLGDLIRHDALFDAYPALTRVLVKSDSTLPPNVNAAYNEVPPTISVNSLLIDAAGFPVKVEDFQKTLRVLLHEIQHYIQKVERFATGGDPISATPIYEGRFVNPILQRIKDLDDEIQRISPAKTIPDVIRLSDLAIELIDQRALLEKAARYTGYHRLAGEVEARTVSKRMLMTAEGRSRRPPWMDYDVPEGKQVVKFALAGSPMKIMDDLIKADERSDFGFYRSENGQIMFALSQKAKRLKADGTAAQWINRNEDAFKDWRPIFKEGLAGLRARVEEMWQAKTTPDEIAKTAAVDLKTYLEEQAQAGQNGMPEVQQAIAIYRANPEAATQQLNRQIGQMRLTQLNRWREYLTEDNPVYKDDPFFRDYVWKDVANLRPDRPDVPLPFDAAAIADVYGRVTNDPDNQSFGRLYEAALAERVKKSIDEGDKVTSTSGREWIRIPRTRKDDPEFQERVNQLRSLSCKTWCTSSSMAAPYLQMGDFWVLRDNGSTVMGLRFYEDKIVEIQGPANDGKIPARYIDEVDELAKKKPDMFSKEVMKPIEEAKKKAVAIARAKEYAKQGNALEAAKLLGYDALPRDNGMIEIAGFVSSTSENIDIIKDFVAHADRVDLRKDFELKNLASANDIELWDRASAPNLKHSVRSILIGEKINLPQFEHAKGSVEMGKGSSAPKLSYVRGKLAMDIRVSTPNVEAVGTDLIVYGNTDLSKLVYVGESATFYGKPKLGSLEFVGYTLHVREAIEMPNLKYVGYSADLRLDSEYPNLEFVGAELMLRKGGSRYPEVRLRSIEELDARPDIRKKFPKLKSINVREPVNAKRRLPLSEIETSAEGNAGIVDRVRQYIRSLFEAPMPDDKYGPMFALSGGREIDDLGYYSKALEEAKKLSGKMTPEQAIKALLNRGVKQAELDAIGLKEALSGVERVTRDELVDLIRARVPWLTETVREVGDFSRQLRDDVEDEMERWRDDILGSTDPYVSEIRGRDREYIDNLDDWRDFAVKHGADEIDEIAFERNEVEALENAGMKFYKVHIEFYDGNNDFVAGVAPDGTVGVIRDNGGSLEILDGTLDSYVANIREKAEQDAWDLIRGQEPERYRETLAEIWRNIVAAEEDAPEWLPYSLDVWNKQYAEVILNLDKQKKVPFHKSGHFNVPNIVGHMQISYVTHAKDGGSVLLINQVQSDWGQALRKRGPRDEYMTNLLQEKMNELDGQIKKREEILAAKIDSALTSDVRETIKKTPFFGRGIIEYASYVIANKFVPRKIADDVMKLMKGISDLLEERINTRARLESLISLRPGFHPLVRSTDQWAATTLRRALGIAVEGDANYIAIPHGDTVLSYNPGKPEGMRMFYGTPSDKGIAGMALEKIIRSYDKNAPQAFVVDSLESSGEMLSYNENAVASGYFDPKKTGFWLFPITDEVRKNFREEGAPLFALSGRGMEGTPTKPEPDFGAIARTVVDAVRPYLSAINRIDNIERDANGNISAVMRDGRKYVLIRDADGNISSVSEMLAPVANLDVIRDATGSLSGLVDPIRQAMSEQSKAARDAVVETLARAAGFPEDLAKTYADQVLDAARAAMDDPQGAVTQLSDLLQRAYRSMAETQEPAAQAQTALSPVANDNYPATPMALEMFEASKYSEAGLLVSACRA